jgi:ParB family chromosome partitioning protein
MGMKLEKVSLDEIDLCDHRFRISYYFELKNLLLSIEKIGLVYPLLVVKRTSPQYILLSGWKRIAACLELSLPRIPVFILDEKDDGQAFLISLYENLSIRKFNLLEKAEVLRVLNGFIPDEKRIVKSFLPIFEIPATLSYLDIYLKIARLTPGCKEMIFQKKIPLSVVEFLIEFAPEEQELLLPILKPLSVNKQKQFMEDLHDLSRRIQETPQKVLSAPDMRSILKKESLLPPQKAELVRSLVKKKRYPHLSVWEESFKAVLKKNRLSSDVTYDAPSFFEDGEFSVTFDLKSKDSFQEKIAKLQELISDETLFRLFKDFPDG